MIILQIFILIITTWLGLSVIYMLIYAVSGLFYKSEIVLINKNLPSIAVLIPAYKEDAVIVDVAIKALKQNYKGSFKVIVIADSLKLETLIDLYILPIKIIEVTFKKSTKAKALNYAMLELGDDMIWQ